MFHSLRCDCGEQLESALAMIEREGNGVLLYLSQEGRGIGLLNKLRAYKLQEGGLDTVEANLQLGLPADLRDYGIGAQILVDLGLSSIRILTNNPKKIRGLEGYGLSVSEQLPIEHISNPHNEDYLRAKRDRMGHTLHHQGLDVDKEMLHDEELRGRGTPETPPSDCPAGGGAGRRSLRDRRRALLRGARRAARGQRDGVFEEAAGAGGVDVFDVPGAFELPLAAQMAAQTGRYAGIACLGAVIRGETTHYDYVCNESARGIQDVALRTGVPCSFGVVTVETMEQAMARTGGGKRDQGAHAARGRAGAAAGARRAALIASAGGRLAACPSARQSRWSRWRSCSSSTSSAA